MNTIELEHVPGCKSSTRVMEGVALSLVYCTGCGKYRYANTCEHQYVKLLAETSNGNTQLREFCKKCCKISGNILPKKGVDTSRMKQKTLVELREFETYTVNEDFANFKKMVDLCREIGHRNYIAKYKSYLLTLQWKEKRSRILKRDGFKCKVCGIPATDVHHLTYENLGHEFDHELVSLCNDCHLKMYHKNKLRRI